VTSQLHTPIPGAPHFTPAELNGYVPLSRTSRHCQGLAADLRRLGRQELEAKAGLRIEAGKTRLSRQTAGNGGSGPERGRSGCGSSSRP